MKFLNTPEYVLRPQQVISRLLFGRHKGDDFMDVRLPWALRIRVRPADTIGRSICTFGLYDLVVTEAIIRLLDPGGTAVDIGANVGHMTGLMAWRSGPGGSVICFEPCSDVFHDLTTNLNRWRDHENLAPVDARQMALSRFDGETDLHIPTYFLQNRGTATLEGHASNGTSSERVTVARLDTVLPGKSFVDVMKIDVEGHEFACLEGAGSLLSEHRIRDIIFEEFGEYPAASHTLLESYGYTIYRLSRTFFKPILCPGNSAWHTPAVSVLPNNLATLDPQRAEARFAGSGWRALSLSLGKMKSATP